MFRTALPSPRTLGPVGLLAGLPSPLHHVLVAGDVSSVQQLVDRRVLQRGDVRTVH